MTKQVQPADVYGILQRMRVELQCSIVEAWIEYRRIHGLSKLNRI